MSPSRARNPELLVVASGLHAALFPIPVITLFWKDQIGMSLADVMVLQAIFGATIMLLEFPSGYIADRLGYRRSLLVGAAFWALGWIVYAVGSTFGAMVVGEVLLGTGMAFTSGADSALLFVSLGTMSDYRRWEGRVRAAAQVSEAVSSGIGGWLYASTPRLPFWCQVPVAVARLGIVAALRQGPGSTPGRRTAHLAHAWHIVRHALLHHARLRSAMGLSVALGISTYVVVWLIQPWMQRRGIPPAWFGPLWAVAHLWLAAVSLVSARLAEVFGFARVLLGCGLLAGASYVALGLSGSPVGAVFYLGFMTVRGLQGPLLASVLQGDAPPEDRASVLSLNALLFRLAAVVVLPPIGALADRLGLEAVLALLGAASLTGALAAWVAFARAHRTG
jgi:predicted MFS family arabinose efflux permease